MSDDDPHMEDPRNILAEQEEAPLWSFDLSSEDGRWRFLWRLSQIDEEGLLAATSHVWASLAPPKALRCRLMAGVAGTGGSGKKALHGVLARFLEDFNRETQPPPLPERKDFATSEEWQAACSGHFAWGDAAMDKVITRYAIILDGGDPFAESKPAGMVIPGPWKKVSRAYRRAREAEQIRARTPDLSSMQDRLRWLVKACKSLLSALGYVEENKWLGEAVSAEMLRRSADEFVTIMHAAGWCRNDMAPDFPIEDAHSAPEEIIGVCSLADLNRYTHTLVRAEAWAYGGESPILDAARAGALKVVAERATELMREFSEQEN